MILLIEDNPLNLKLVRELLEAVGYVTVCATTAREALAVASESVPRLVLLDMQLPDGDGFEVLAQLRTDARTATVPVLALTASAMHEERERILNDGFNGYLAKPIDIWRLLEQVRKYR
jgi:two-component system cell cycle response regulator DivK